MNWAIKRLRPYRYWLLLAVLTAVFFGCLTKQEPDTFTLPEKFVDSLSQYDSVQIVLKDTSGKTLDVLFHGKVVFADQLRNLPAPHALEGHMLVTIIGYQNGKVTYRVDRLYDGRTHQVETHQPIILPTSKVSFDVAELRIPKKTTLPLPIVTVEPADLADKTLIWTSSNTKVFEIGAKGLLGIAPGTAFLHVALKSDTAKHADIPITVVANPKLPDSLRISPDTLKLAAKGRAGQFIVQAFPATAGAVSWHLEGETVASIIGNGQVQGLKRGAAVVRVVSKEDEMISDSAVVAVSDPIPVESVRFPKTKLDLFVEGAAESLLVEVRPLEANPEAVFSVRDSSIARILNGRVLGLREGVTDVIAMSSENPAKTDSLRVTVYPTQKVESLRLTPDTLRLYVGGEAKTLQVELFPSTLAPLIQWNSASPSIAAVDSAGRINPVSEGKTFVTAISKADSGKKDASLILVKRDIPILDVGRDTTISVGQTVTFTPKVSQEYGTVIRFKWDLNGDGAWDDSASGLKSVTYKYDLEKELAVAFYVRDTEGNDKTVLKKIRVVDGPVVLILSPLDSTYTRLFSIDVSWSVNGKEQDSLKKQGLKIGENTITRSAKDEAGKIYSASVMVIVDTTAPNKPVVHGPLVTNSQTPTWSWTSGGGGSGIFKYWLDVDDSSKGRETRDTGFSQATDLSEGAHTLFVAERDLAGNWSTAGRLTIRIDLTPPGTPSPKPGVVTQFNTKRPTWFWLSGGSGSGKFRVKIDEADLSKDAIPVSEFQFTSGKDLAEGGHILYVQESDSAGNWSKSAILTLIVDLTPPNTPIFISVPRSPVNTLRPKWVWKSAGGGIKQFRYRFDSDDFSLGHTTYRDSILSTPIDLPEGRHSIFVQESDSAGNWSLSGSATTVLALHGPVGIPGFTSGVAFPRSLIIHPSGQPYIAFEDMTLGKLTVMKYSRTNWIPVGPEGISAGKTDEPDMALSDSGVPYVVYGDYTMDRKILVKRFNGSGWEQIGGADISKPIGKPGMLAVNDNSQPVLIFKNFGDSNKAQVKKWTGSTWELMGSGFVSDGDAESMQLKIAPNGNPIIAFRDSKKNSRVVVKKWEGTSWNELWDMTSTEGLGFYCLALALDRSGMPIVALNDSASGGKLVVKKYSGAAWIDLGNSFTGEIEEVAIAVNSLNQPVVAYIDKTDGRKIRIAQFNGTSWDFFTGIGRSDEVGIFLRLVLDTLDVPYIGFTDRSRDSKATVLKVSFDP
jgi:hypothetical protein